MIKSNLEDRRQAVDALVAEASKLAESNPEVAIERANAAKSLAGDLCLSEDEYATEVATCEIVLARAAYAMSQFDVSLQAARSAETLAQQTNDPSILMNALGCVGAAYARLSNYARGMTAFNQQLTLALAQGDLEQQGAAHHGLTIIYGETKQFEDALHHASQSLAIADALGNFNKKAAHNANLCRITAHLAQYEKALTHGFKALSLANEYGPEYVSPAYSSLAFCYSELGQYEEAIRFYILSLESLAENHNSYFEAITSVEIARAYRNCDRLELAREYAAKALHKANESKNKWTAFQAHQLLSQLAEQREAYETALYHHRKFQQIQNEALGEKNAEKMRHLQVTFEVASAQREAEAYRNQTEELAALIDVRTAALESALTREKSLGIDLSQALEVSQATNEMRSGVITQIAREFSAPAASISTLVEQLIQRSAEMPTVEQQALYRRVIDHTDYLRDFLQSIVVAIEAP